jgi:hypothetical protein
MQHAPAGQTVARQRPNFTDGRSRRRPTPPVYASPPPAATAARSTRPDRWGPMTRRKPSHADVEGRRQPPAAEASHARIPTPTAAMLRTATSSVHPAHAVRRARTACTCHDEEVDRRMIRRRSNNFLGTARLRGRPPTRRRAGSTSSEDGGPDPAACRLCARRPARGTGRGEAGQQAAPWVALAHSSIAMGIASTSRALVRRGRAVGGRNAARAGGAETPQLVAVAPCVGPGRCPCVRHARASPHTMARSVLGRTSGRRSSRPTFVRCTTLTTERATGPRADPPESTHQ